MGDDSEPRTITNIIKSSGNLYQVVPSYGDSFKVGEEHTFYMQFLEPYINDKSNNKQKRKSPYLVAYYNKDNLRVSYKSFTISRSLSKGYQVIFYFFIFYFL